MEVDGSNLQNEFFNQARKDRKLLTVFLSDGRRLAGRIKSFDKFTLLLEGSQGEMIVFKHAISTVGPAAEAETSHHAGDETARKEPAPAGGRQDKQGPRNMSR